MKSTVVKFALIALVIASLGCVGTKSFVRMPEHALILGQTTPEQVYSQLGPANREGFVNRNDLQIKVVYYVYSGVPLSGIVSQRSQHFYFSDNKLVGYEFASSWEEDSTNFDSSKVSQIKKGESTRSYVVHLFGNPGGKRIYPLVPNKAEEAISYRYTEFKGLGTNMKIYQKTLAVTFDKQDVVTNVEFTESGTP